MAEREILSRTIQSDRVDIASRTTRVSESTESIAVTKTGGDVLVEIGTLSGELSWLGRSGIVLSSDEAAHVGQLLLEAAGVGRKQLAGEFHHHAGDRD